MGQNKNQSLNWLFGLKKKRRVVVPIQKPKVVELPKTIELPKPGQVYNPIQYDSLGYPFKYFVDINLKTNEPIVNEKIKDYRDF